MEDEDFLNEVENVIKIYEDLIGRIETRTRQMIQKYEAFDALSRLITNPYIQQGFKILYNSNKLDKTFEFIIVKYSDLFKPEIIEAAQWRLDNPENLLDRE